MLVFRRVVHVDRARLSCFVTRCVRVSGLNPIWNCSHGTHPHPTGDFAMEPEKIKRGRPRKEARDRCSVWLTPDVAKILREYSKYVGCAITETIESALNEKLPSMRRTLGIDA